MLSLPLSRAATARARPELRRGRCARRAARDSSARSRRRKASSSFSASASRSIGRLLLIDALSMHFRTVKLRKDPNCPACGTHEITELIDYDQFCGVVPEATVANTNEIPEITPSELAARMRRGDDIDLIDVREPHELDIARIPNVRLIPLGTFAEALPTLDSSRDMVVHLPNGRAQRPRRAAAARGGVSGRCGTSRAAFIGGRTKSIRRCRSTNRSS